MPGSGIPAVPDDHIRFVSSRTCAIDSPGDFIFRKTLRTDRTKHQLIDRATKGTLNQMVDKVRLCLLFRVGGPVDLRPLFVILDQQPFFSHHLHHLQRRAVTGLAFILQRVVHLANGTGANLPEGAQDLQFNLGRCA